MPPSRPLSGRVRKRIAPSFRTATKAAPRRCGFSAFSPRIGRSSGSPRENGAAVLAHRAKHAARPLRRADRRAEIHHRLREVARPVGGDQLLQQHAYLGLRIRQRRADLEQPRHHALDIAVDHRLPSARRRSRRSLPPCRRRCPATRASLLLCREYACQRGRHEVGAFLQVAGARVVAEAGPGLHDVVGSRCRKVRHLRPFFEEFSEIRLHRLDRRLLQHDFRHPDVVGIGPDAGGERGRRNPPRQVAMVGVVPGEQPAGHAVLAATFPCGLCR